MRYIPFIFLFPLLYCSTVDDETAAWVKEILRKNKATIKRSGPDLTPTRLRPKPHKENNSPTETTLNLNPSVQEGRSCITKDNLNGECVSYYLCDENSRIIDDGADLLDLRDGSKACSHHLEICCELNSIQDPPTMKPQSLPHITRPPTTTPTSPLSIPSIETLSSPDANDNKVSTSECGWSNIKISSYEPKNPAFRPKNVTSAFYGEYPFLVAVMTRGDTDVWSSKFYVGGGVLIHHRVVLTVAHNIMHSDAEQLKCRAGEYDVQTIKEQYPHQERNVNKITVHEHFYIVSVHNDIALLFLESEFTPAPSIGIACLASVFPPGEDCYSMGWGREAPIEIRDHFVKVLKKVPLPLVKAEDCQDMLRSNSRLGPFFELHDSLTCAGGESTIDTCRGDGGSPLVCAVNTSGYEKRYVVTGLVAYGLGCGITGIPGVYVNIPNLYDWVTTQMDREHIEKKFVL